MRPKKFKKNRTVDNINFHVKKDHFELAVDKGINRFTGSIIALIKL